MVMSVAVTTLLWLLKELALLGPGDDPVVLYAAMLRLKVDLDALLAGTVRVQERRHVGVAH